jgi:hypothetical protein
VQSINNGQLAGDLMNEQPAVGADSPQLMVWLLPSARSAGLFIILLWTFPVAVGHFPDAVASSADAAFVVFSSHASISD